MKILAKTFAELEDVLEHEIIEIGGLNTSKTKRGVWFEGDKKLLYKANLHLRSALRLLVPIYEFTAYDERRLYKHIQEFDWEEHLSISKTFAIDAVTRSQRFKHSQYVALKIKDAIVDQFRDKTGKRPDIDTKNPDILINVHLNNAKFTLSLDSSGETLNKRGYRSEGHPASLNESLAAGLILKTNWKGDTNFLDPFCGSGTFPIEAAMIAGNIAPGIKRKFAFQNWKDYDRKLLKDLKIEAEENSKEIKIKIFGSDISERSIKTANKSVNNAGYDAIIKLKRESFDLISKPSDSGIIITNPPYGERLEENNMIDFYQKIGDTLKQNFTNWDAWILSGNIDALKRIGLKTSKKTNCFNGDIECKFNKYEMYKGSYK